MSKQSVFALDPTNQLCHWSSICNMVCNKSPIGTLEIFLQTLSNLVND